MKTFLEHIDFGLYEGKHVPLERPMVDITEEEDKELNKPKKEDEYFELFKMEAFNRRK